MKLKEAYLKNRFWIWVCAIFCVNGYNPA